MTSPATGPANPPAPPSAWSPLRYPLFRALWIATVASNVGTWMQNVGAVWLMTSLVSRVGAPQVQPFALRAAPQVTPTLGADVTLCWYPSGHALVREEIDDAREWLSGRI